MKNIIGILVLLTTASGYAAQNGPQYIEIVECKMQVPTGETGIVHVLVDAADSSLPGLVTYQEADGRPMHVSSATITGNLPKISFVAGEVIFVGIALKGEIDLSNDSQTLKVVRFGTKEVDVPATCSRSM